MFLIPEPVPGTVPETWLREVEVLIDDDDDDCIIE